MNLLELVAVVFGPPALFMAAIFADALRRPPTHTDDWCAATDRDLDRIAAQAGSRLRHPAGRGADR